MKCPVNKCFRFLPSSQPLTAMKRPQHHNSTFLSCPRLKCFKPENPTCQTIFTTNMFQKKDKVTKNKKRKEHPPPEPSQTRLQGQSTHLPYLRHCAQLVKHSKPKHCGCTWIGMLNSCAIAYAPNGTPHTAHRNIMVAGRPSVDLVR